MSLPREILDQLLSGYLDDALSADEHARVQRLLETDPEIARELEELRGIRTALQDVAKADSTFRLPAGFADRVLDTAIATARSEGLNEDHPLIRLAEQPSPKRTSVAGAGHHRPVSSWRAAGVLVALAASVVFAVVALRPEMNPVGPSNAGIAMTDPDPSNITDPSNNPAQVSPPESIVGVPDDSEDELTRVAQSSSTDDDPSLTTPEVAVDSMSKGPLLADVAVPGSTPSPSVQPDARAIAVNDSAGEPERGSSAVPQMVSSTPRRNRLSAILVVDIKQTEQGRQNDVVNAALRAVGIGAASQKSITDEVVGIAKDVDPAGEDSDATLMYLQVSAKRLDRFVLTMVADQQGVESVHFILAEDAPILGVAQSLQPVDPTEVQHAGAWQLATDSDQWVGAIAHDLAGRADYLAIDSNTAQAGAASMMSQPPKSGGPDFMSQILLLIR